MQFWWVSHNALGLGNNNDPYVRGGQLILWKISKVDVTRSNFKAKMHQIRFPLGLRLRHRWECIQRSPCPPDSLAVF